MWKAYIDKIKRKCTLAGPARIDQFPAAANALGLDLPEDHRALLGEPNGIASKYGDGSIWAVDRIVEQNRTFRTFADFGELDMPFDDLLFLRDNGDGSQFAFPIQADGLIHESKVFGWNHENDARPWVAESLRAYLE